MLRRYGLYFGFVLLCLGLFILGYCAEQTHFFNIFSGYTLAFVGYTFIIFSNSLNSERYLIWAIITSIIAVPFFPNLSDDIYRFIWDGYSLSAGINPYSYLPSQIVGQYEGLSPELFEQLNSKEYYSVYPTISQFFFGILPLIAEDILLQAIALKIIYFIFHSLGAWAIFKFFRVKNWNTSSLLFYYANPLVIMEGIGNLHAEINMVSAMFIALYFWDRKSDWLSAFWFSTSVFIKLLPVLLLSYFVLRWQQRKRYRYYFFKVCIFSCILAIPMVYGIFAGGFLDSIDLYFRKFEFNASVYYLLRWLGIQVSGYNLIKYLGPGLLLIFLLINFKKLNKKKQEDSFQNFISAGIFILTTYLFFSTTIHPWYLIGLIGLSVFLPRLYIFIWSFLITLTYISYNQGVYIENLWIVALEYILVFTVFIAEEKNLISIRNRLQYEN